MRVERLFIIRKIGKQILIDTKKFRIFFLTLIGNILLYDFSGRKLVIRGIFRGRKAPMNQYRIK